MADDQQLLVRVGRIVLALPAMEVRGIRMPPAQLTRLPGAIEVRVFEEAGAVVAVEDLRAKFGTGMEAEGRVVLATAGGSLRGFRVDEVLGLVATGETVTATLPPQLPRRHFTGALLHRDQLVLCSDFERLHALSETLSPAVLLGNDATPHPHVPLDAALSEAAKSIRIQEARGAAEAAEKSRDAVSPPEPRTSSAPARAPTAVPQSKDIAQEKTPKEKPAVVAVPKPKPAVSPGAPPKTSGHQAREAEAPSRPVPPPRSGTVPHSSGRSDQPRAQPPATHASAAAPAVKVPKDSPHSVPARAPWIWLAPTALALGIGGLWLAWPTTEPMPSAAAPVEKPTTAVARGPATSAAKTPVATPPPFPARPLSNKPNSEVAVHTVQPGDTLWEVAKRYTDDPWAYARIARESGITDPDRIAPGQQLRIPADDKR